MRENGVGKCCSALACVVGLLAAPAAWAQDPAPPPADPGAAADPAGPATTPPVPPAEPTATAPAPASAATAGEATPVTPAPGTTEPVGEPKAEESQIPSWFRFDADNYGLQVWAGASHKLGPIDLASDIYLTTSGYAEFDIGPAFVLGPVIVNPMVGIGFDFMNHLTATLVAPQLYLYIDAKPVYFESWNMMQFNSVFNEGAQNYYYSRHFLLLYPVDDFGIGPHLELNVDVNELPGATAAETDDTGLSSLQIGGIIGLNYGTGNKLLMYLGYETQEEGRVNIATGAQAGKLAGRFTFVHNF
ncbi:hypothetical protein WMF37_16575 [Sorangium sp. So ce291]|uniref:hypothetical protein n=1 Tax=Sorangium sp. So ce291 TaxID=3133294 RepID=UPI003F62C86E